MRLKLPKSAGIRTAKRTISHNGQGLLLCWYSLNVLPGTAADWKYEDEVNNKKLNRITSAGATADSDKKMRIYSSASIAANPLLYAYPIFSVIYNVGLCRTAWWLPCVGQGRLLGRLAFVLWVCVPAHVPDLQRWLVREFKLFCP